MEENITKRFLRGASTDQNILVVDDELVNHILIFQVRSTDGQEIDIWISIVVKQMYVKVGIHCEMEDQTKLIISLGL